MGTWKPNYKHIIRKDEYCVFFYRLYEEDWGYMGMRDYATEEPTDQFMVKVIKWRPDPHRKGGKIADEVCRKYCVLHGDKDIMNTLWWNFTNRNIPFSIVESYFKELKEGGQAS